MALKLVLGRAGCGKTEHCLSEMRARLLEAAEGTPLVMILPEHATFKVEKELASTPGLGGFTRGFVFGFRRLAQRILMETGGALRPRITDIGKRLLLAKIMETGAADFKALGRAAKQRNFTETLTAMIEEFKSYGIKVAQLAEVTETMPDSPLKDKLSDLAFIYQGFAEGMQGRYTDAEDYLDLMAEKLALSSMLEDAEVWIDGFIFFNPQETAILSEMLKTAKSVTITLCISEPDSPQHRLETSLFYRQYKTRQELRALAENLAIPVTEMELTENYRLGRQADLFHIEQNFYRFPIRGINASGSVQVVEAANRRLEVEGIAVDIRRLCREKQYRWRDIGILVRDSESYTQLLETILSDYGIPFFSDSKRKSVHHPLAELLRSALEAIHGWRYEPLFRCFKTDFFDITRSQLDLLENYVLEFGIRGSRWTMPEDWQYRRRLSLDEDTAPDAQQAEMLAEINAVRRLAALPLMRFEQRMKAAENCAAMTAGLYELFVDLQVPQKLEKWAFAAEDQGHLDEAREHRQLWDSIVLFFEQLVQTCGQEKLSALAYENIINDGLEGLTLSLIPPGLDYVAIASLDQNSLDNTKAIYIVGANEGVLPKRARGEGLLTDVDRLELAGIGLTLSPGAGADNFAERYLIYHALTRASAYLWVSYSLADSEGSGLSPSLLVHRLREMLGIKALRALPLEIAAGAETEVIAEPRQALSRLAAALRDYRKSEQLSPIWRDVYNWALGEEKTRPLMRTILAGLFHSGKVLPLPPELAGKLYTKNKRLNGSVTRFERFRACPFKHFAQYGLSLKERAEFRFEAPDLGQFLHAALKEFGERMRAEARDWGSVKDPEYQAICKDIVEGLAPKLRNEILLSSARYQHVLGRIRLTVERAVKRLIAFDRASEFKPVGLEKSFGRGKDALPPLTYFLEDGYRLEITGQIDRIDSIDDEGNRYFLILDYKSGNAYINLIDVYYGLKLQLLTYLLVAQNSAQTLLGKAALPAGVLYYILKNPVLTEKYKLPEKEALDKINAALRMPGWILADVDMVRRIDSSFKFIKVSVTAKDTIHGNSKNSIKTEAEFIAMLGYVDRILADTGRQILRGDVAVSPFALEGREACEFCNFPSFCQFDRLLPEHEYRKLAKLENDEIMQSLMKGDE